LKLFPWGYYARSGRAAVKLHLLLSLQGNLPAWGAITEAHCPDVKILDRMQIVAGAVYIMDRGYLDFIRLSRIHQAGGWFVVRSKRGVRYREIESRPTSPATDLIEIRSDQVVRLKSEESRRTYREKLRKVIIYVFEEKRSLVILTNNLQWSAEEIAQFYKSRWQVELFFKWIKQHLRLHNFYGRSENAVRSQIWSAICAYLMVAILKKQLKVEKSLYEILQLISVNPFEKLSFCELLRQKPSAENSSAVQNTFVFNEN
jgi:IS4 transposase